MVDGISSAVPGTVAAARTGTQSRTAALETAFPGLRVLGSTGDAAQPQQGGGFAVGAGPKPALASGDTLLAAQQQQGEPQGGDGKPQVPGELSEEEKQQVAKLKQTDAKVRAHERAHAAVGGQYAGAPSYSYTRGPDGQQYATGGEVSIDIGAERDPEATLQKAAQVQAAALAPADPSGQDRAVAAAAAQLRLQALAQIRAEKKAEAEQQDSDQAADKAATAESATAGRDGVASSGEAQPGTGKSTSETATGPAVAGGGNETPAVRASRAYANDDAGLNRLVGQAVGISA